MVGVFYFLSGGDFSLASGKGLENSVGSPARSGLSGLAFLARIKGFKKLHTRM
jgi:hypothetical protein